MCSFPFFSTFLWRVAFVVADLGIVSGALQNYLHNQVNTEERRSYYGKYVLHTGDTNFILGI
jgi:hypothetical protein